MICGIVYAAIIAAVTWLVYEGFLPHGAGIPAIVGIAASPSMLLTGLGYLMFGKSKRLRIRHPRLILLHFYPANISVILALTIGPSRYRPQNIPPAIVEFFPIALYLFAGGVFVVNLWRSLRSGE